MTNHFDERTHTWLRDDIGGVIDALEAARPDWIECLNTMRKAFGIEQQARVVDVSYTHADYEK